MRAHRHQPCITHAGLQCSICKATGEQMLAAERAAVEAMALVLRSLVQSGALADDMHERAEHALRVAAGKVRR